MSHELPTIAQALLKPGAYSEQPSHIDLMQTQMSFIFLADQFVYKIKKPVNLGYLDYSSLDKRHFFCQQELKLNRRLCPEAYLTVVPVKESDGNIHLGGSGNIIDYAVKMKRLPRERMMDILLPQNKVTIPMIENVAIKMGAFHSQAAYSPEISSFGSLEMIKTNTDENFNQTKKYIGTILSRPIFDNIRYFTNKFIKEQQALFEERVKFNKIRDCHGDLHAAHICFADDIYIYDCIEFNDRFRYCDTASEMAFLAMDLDRFGRADLSNALVEAYIAASKDHQIAKLLNFYKCYRAYVRGKVACFKYDDPYLSDKDSILKEAKLYFNLAHRYADARPTMIIVSGLIGTGKTTVAEKIGQGLGINVLSSDVIRKKLAEVPAKERHFDDFGKGLYSDDFTKKTYSEMFRQAAQMLQSGQSVILDASFKKKNDRLAAYQLTALTKAKFLAIECIANESTIKQRLERRVKTGSVSDGRWEIFQDIKAGYEPINEFQSNNHWELDTTIHSGNIIASILERMSAL